MGPSSNQQPPGIFLVKVTCGVFCMAIVALWLLLTESIQTGSHIAESSLLDQTATFPGADNLSRVRPTHPLVPNWPCCGLLIQAIFFLLLSLPPRPCTFSSCFGEQQSNTTQPSPFFFSFFKSRTAPYCNLKHT